VGEIIHSNGWSLGWSFLFDFIMFPMLRLHHKYPLIAYILSVPIAIFFIFLFDVPIEKRNTVVLILFSRMIPLLSERL
jgi:hypothetical protein